MKRVSLSLTTVILAALLLAACGGQGTSTSMPGTNVSGETANPMSTEMPVDTATMDAAGTTDLTTTPNVPVTGDDSPNRLTNLTGYDVWNQSGEQIGTVKDVVLDFNNSSMPYVLVGTGGFLGIGEKEVLVPWKMLKLQTDGKGTGSDQNAFVYTGDQDFYKNFPDTDLSTLLPGTTQSAKNWDATIQDYWKNGVSAAENAQATNTPEGAGMTATPEATMAAIQGIQKLQGAILASDLLRATIEVNNNSTGTTNGQSQGAATEIPAATQAPANGDTTTTPAPAVATTVSDLGTGNSMGTMDLTADDVIVDPNTGKVQYVVVSGAFTDGQRTVALPLKYLQWDATNQKFSLGVNTLALVQAPAFEDGQYPDFSTKDWSGQIEKFWNNLKPDMLSGTQAP